MANIIQIQDDLKNVSDQDLVNFVKRPTGQVPSYLALGEIKRRKETRDKYQGQKAQQKSTVAEDLVAEQGIGNQMTRNPMPQPTAGVGAPQPVNPAMLASKGIGQLNPGAVKQMNDGGIVGYKTGDLVRKIQAENAQLNYGMSPYSNSFADPIRRQAFRQPELELLREKNSLINDLEGQIAGVEAQPNTLDNINTVKELNRQLKAVETTPIKGGGYEQGDETLFSPMVFADKSIDSEPQKFVGTSMNVDETIKSTDDVVDGTVQSLTKESITEDIDTDTDTVDSKLDIANLDIPDILSKEQRDLFTGRRSNRPKELTTEEAIKQVLETNKAAGLLANPFDQDRKDLEKERKLLDKAKSDEGSMAFIKAGLLWMQKGNLGDAAPAVTEYAQALKGLRGEDRELKKMDLALRGADIAYRQGNVKAASDLVSAAEKRLDTFDRDTFTNMQQAMTQGLANRINIQKANMVKDTSLATAQLSSDTSRYVADKSLEKQGAKAEMYNILAQSPAFQKKDGTVDAEKIMKSISPPSSMYAANSKPAQFMSEWNTTVKDLSANPEMADRLTAFLEKYPDPVAFANAMGAGSSMGTYTTKGGYKPAGS